ncbi:MAG: AgmX/PglI C-terminal domain-containing protein [Pseudobdellovibrionaceae bacterium]
MSTAQRLILENKMGQGVRSLSTQSDNFTLIYRYDLRKIELHSDLTPLKDAEVSFDVLEKISVAALRKGPKKIVNGQNEMGFLRLANPGEVLVDFPSELPNEDEQEMQVFLKKTAASHAVIVAILILIPIVMSYFSPKKEEQQVVKIVLPQKNEKVQPVPRVQVSERKIKPTNRRARVAKTPKIKPVVKRNVTAPKKVANRQVPKNQKSSVRNAPTRSLERIGALAALGGVKNGARNAEGLDMNSLKNIRSAGVGSGGGGVGHAGRGGVSGLLPGHGLIAGSAGSGGAATSAGGYGTKGVGGGKAGYGKISLVGGTSGISLPSDEEVTMEGGLDRDQIQAVINRNKGQIIYCYEQGLQGAPDLRGRVSVDFVIGPAGKITKARVANSSLGSQSVEACMIAKMRTWQFPRPVGSVNVDVLYPFELRRVSSR